MRPVKIGDRYVKSVAEAAKIAGVTRSTLYRRIKRGASKMCIDGKLLYVKFEKGE